MKKFSLNVRKNEKGGLPKGLDPAISTFFVQLPNRLQNVLKVGQSLISASGLKIY